MALYIARRSQKALAILSCSNIHCYPYFNKEPRNPTFFFLISKKIIKKKPQRSKRPNKYREGHKQRESKKRQNTNGTNQKLITKKRTKEQRDRITRGESPSPRPIKERATKISEQLIIGLVPILKSTPVSLPPNTPH